MIGINILTFKYCIIKIYDKFKILKNKNII